MTKAEGQRLANLEGRFNTLEPMIAETHADVKTLLAAHNRQKGFVTVAKLTWGALIAGATLASDWAFTHWHH
jgi:hypothetical protein